MEAASAASFVGTGFKMPHGTAEVEKFKDLAKQVAGKDTKVAKVAKVAPSQWCLGTAH